MATNNGCFICGKDNPSLQCQGCLERFCSNDIIHHREELIKQLEQIESKRNDFQEQFSQKSSSFEEIDYWEKESIESVQRIAEEKRDEVRKYDSKIENQLKELTKELRHNRQH